MLNRERRRREEGAGPEEGEGEGVCPAAVGAASGERNPMPTERRARAVQVSCEPVVLCCQVEFGEQLLRRGEE